MTPLPFQSVRLMWDRLRGWVDKVQGKTASDWRTEDVYAELKEGRATAFLALEQGTPKGLLVLAEVRDPITRRKELAMWVAYSESTRLIDYTLDQVEIIARNGGFSAITGASPRKGWLRRLAPKGYNLVAYHFEKRL